MISRGIRNNNPGNIRKSRDKWQGLAEKQADKEFFVFKAPEWGIRALARVLIKYQDKHKLDTLTGIINRYAPPTENKTKAYITAVSLTTGFQPNQKLDLHTYEHLFPLVKAIIKHENGVQPYDDGTINHGVMLAGVQAPLKPLRESRTLKGSAITTGSVLATGALDQAQQSFLMLSDYLEIARWGLLALALFGIGRVVYAYYDDRKRKVS